MMRHSGTTAASVWLEGLHDHLVLTVEDNGAGLDANIASVRASLELTSMRERAEFANGQFLIRSAKGKGTRIEVRVPYRSALSRPDLDGHCDSPRLSPTFPKGL